MNNLEQAINKGRTKWLKDYLRKNLPKLDDNDHYGWFNSFIQTMKDRGIVQPAKQKDYLSDVRNAIRILDLNHPALLVVNFDKKIWIDINNKNSDRIAKRTTKLIDDPDAIVQKATALLESYIWSEMAAGLVVLTGRRCTEILKTASFKYQTKYSVIFKGSLKKKSNLVECIFEIPTLCEAELVIKTICSLKGKLGGEINKLSNKEAYSRYGRAVAKKCDEFFTELVPPRDDKDSLYSHLFRAIYGTIASYWYCPHLIPEIEFRASIHGHYQILNEKNPELRRSLAASRYYFDYKISDGNGNIDGRLGIKLNLPGVQVVAPFLNYYDSRPLTKKSNKRRLKSIMTEISSNSSGNLAIPPFLHSRLQAISNQLEIPIEEAIPILFTWTEVGLSLVKELNLGENNPNAVFNSIKSLKQNASSSSPTINSIDSNQVNDPEESARLKQQVFFLTNSLDRLTEIFHKFCFSEQTTNVDHNSRQNKQSSTVHKAKINPSPQPQNDSSSNTKRKRDSSDTVEKDINHGIDSIIEFNDTEEQPHNKKFYIGIGAVRELCGRGDMAIRKLLKSREQEILDHLDKHQLTSHHNHNRKDDDGNDYPTIDEEKEINYSKITEVLY